MGRARDWLDTIPSNTITTWDLLTEFFLDKFFPTARTERLISEIQDFNQHSNETLYEAYERFTELLRKCLPHGLRPDQLLRNFYRGLNESSATVLDTRALDGWIIDMVPEEAFELIDKLTGIITGAMKEMKEVQGQGKCLVLKMSSLISSRHK